MLAEPCRNVFTESSRSNLQLTRSLTARRDLERQVPPGPWLVWAARLVPAVATEAVIAWLDAGQPDRSQAAERIAQVIHGTIQATGPARQA
jgi:hypothetical protein